MSRVGSERPTGEVLVVWGLFALSAIAVLITYSRLPATELYNVSGTGLAAGLGRVLVHLNYPVALAAIGVLAVLLERGAPRVPAWIGIGLCALTPFTVDQSDLDARVVNVGPAVGVLIAVALTFAARPRRVLAPRSPLDPARLAIAAGLLVIAVPWYFAELGFYAPDPILADEIPRGEKLHAVHLGHHHGLTGTLLALSALLLSRVVVTLPARAAVALMFVYGVANAIQDMWFEQIVKRSWTDAAIPSLVLPSLSVGWAVIVATAAALTALSLRRRAGSCRSPAPAAEAPVRDPT